jgi:N-acetylglucosaminyldiphosphoundecaprenol N-acetyl-beta-D-mannosaminyltransferase
LKIKHLDVAQIPLVSLGRRYFIGKKLFTLYNEFMDNLSILGVRISNLDRAQLLAQAKGFLADGKQHFIVTPNPEILLAATHDEELFYILNSADIALGDGIGLKFAGWMSGVNLQRVTGADFSADLLALAVEDLSSEASAKGGKIKVGILIWKNGLSKRAELEEALRAKYPQLDFFVSAMDRESDAKLGEEFIKFAPQIILVGFGFPYQEKFIFHNLKNIPSAKILIGVGGTLDFITGKRRRAPQIIRTIGLEWFWRFLFSPQIVGQKRTKRIWNAVFVFPREFFIRKFIHPLFYRQNIACLLYKKAGDRYQILIAERREESGHWQLPQGGTDGEKLLIAGARELREELNTDKFIPKRVFKNVYRYKFGNRPGETSIQAKTRQRHTGYKGQSQGLFIAEFTGRDEDIKVNYWDHSAWKWIDSDKLVDEVHLIRKRATQRFLKKFKEFVKQK